MAAHSDLGSLDDFHSSLYTAAIDEAYDGLHQELLASGQVRIDGFFRSILSCFADLPFDGFEGLTPPPQGDVPLEQIRTHIGEKVLVDSIPAVLFLPSHLRETLMETVDRTVAAAGAGRLGRGAAGRGVLRGDRADPPRFGLTLQLSAHWRSHTGGQQDAGPQGCHGPLPRHALRAPYYTVDIIRDRHHGGGQIHG